MIPSIRNIAILTILIASAFGCGRQSTNKPVAEVKLTGDQLCSRDLKQFVQFKDPDSVRINSVVPNEQRPGRYLMSVSAKNSYGGYGDPTNCSCGTADGKVTDLHCDGMGGS